MTQILTTGKEISLYFHIPFCSKKCHYCHFYSVKYCDNLKNKFLLSLQKEWEKKKDLLANSDVVSIYFGGGTPSLLEAEDVDTIISLIQKTPTITISPSCEVTLEFNPDNISKEKILGYKASGINRISIGVQSFHDATLKLLGRTHTSKKSIEAINTVNACGIDNISIDIMYDLPKQNKGNWKKTVSHISDLPITHLSLYNLVIEPKTLFYKRKEHLKKIIPNDELSLALLDEAIEQFEMMGLHRYEVSAFARDNKVSRHNTGYWLGRSFFGFGPSAFSYVDGKRSSNISNINHYIQALDENKCCVDFEERLPYPQNVLELFIINLRLTEGVDIEAFESKWSPLPSHTKTILSSLVNNELLSLTSSRYKLTKKGLIYYDTIASELI
jgi:oxygen-independent coproporphyrinogen III oxidase